MPRHALRWLVFPLLAVLAACNAGSIDTTPLTPLGPAVSPASLTFSAAGQTQRSRSATRDCCATFTP